MQGPQLIEANQTIAVEIHSREDVHDVLQFLGLQLVRGLNDELSEVVQGDRLAYQLQVRMLLCVDLLDGDLLFAQQPKAASHRGLRQSLHQRHSEEVKSTWRRNQNDLIVLEYLEVEHGLVHDLEDIHVEPDVILTQLVVQLQETAKELEARVLLAVLEHRSDELAELLLAGRLQAIPVLEVLIHELAHARACRHVLPLLSLLLGAASLGR